MTYITINWPIGVQKIYCQSNLTANQKRALCSTLPCQSNLTANQKSIVQYIALSIKFNSQSKESIVQYIALSIKFNSQSKESIGHTNTQYVWGTPIEVWTMGKLWQKIWSPVTIIPFIFGFPWLSQYWMAGRNYSEGGRLFLLVNPRKLNVSTRSITVPLMLKARHGS